MNRKFSVTPSAAAEFVMTEVFTVHLLRSAQQLWQVVVVNQREAAAAHTLWQQNKCSPCPPLTSLPGLPLTLQATKVSREKKARSSCLNHSGACCSSRTQRLVSKCHVLWAMQSSEGAFSLSKSHHSHSDTYARNHGFFLDIKSIAKPY